MTDSANKPGSLAGVTSSLETNLPGGPAVSFAVLSVVFLAIGIGLLAVRSATLSNIGEAQHWVAVACVMEYDDHVRINSKGNKIPEDAAGETLDRYSVFRYIYNGKQYRSDRLDLQFGQTGNYKGWERKLFKEHPSGSEAVCYVDPNAPANAVFDRDHGINEIRFLPQMAFPFLCAGIGFALASMWTVLDSHTWRMLDLTGRIGFWRSAIILTADPSKVIWIFVVGFSFWFVAAEGREWFADLFGIWKKVERTEGQVIWVQGTGQRELGLPVYEFEFKYLVAGETYTSKSFSRNSIFGKQLYHKGDRVEIDYNPANPSSAWIAHTRTHSAPLLLSAIPLAVLFLLVFILGCLYLQNFRYLRLVTTRPSTKDWTDVTAGDSVPLSCFIDIFVAPLAIGAIVELFWL